MKKFILAGFLFFTTLVANATVLKDFDITFGNISTNTGRDVTVIDLLGQIDSFEAVLANFENEGDILNFLSPKPGSKWSFEDVLAYRALDSSELKTSIGLGQLYIDGSSLEYIGISFRDANWNITAVPVSSVPELSVVVLLLAGLGVLGLRKMKGKIVMARIWATINSSLCLCKKEKPLQAVVFFVKKITSIGIQTHLLQILISKQRDISRYYYASWELKKHR
jgi:hypothetical protein